MAKFTYIGDPSEGKKQSSQETTFKHRDTGEEVKFLLGEPREVPEWLAARLKTSNHFKSEDSAVKLTDETEPKDAQKSKDADKPKK